MLDPLNIPPTDRARYTGINKHEGEEIGLYDTVITKEDALKVFENVPKGNAGNLGH